MSVNNINIIKNSAMIILSLLASLILLSISSQAVSAQSEDVSQESTIQVVDSVQLQTADYKYTAEPCDSLTKLVRRAILTYDQANDQIEMSKEGIIYAETNIVQNMGAYWLDVGDEVVVLSAEVAKYAESSLSLTPSQVAAWSVYVPTVDFEIIDIQQPENVEDIVEDITTQLDDKASTEDTEENSSTSAYWWFAGIGSAAIVWYLLWKREEA